MTHKELQQLIRLGEGFTCEFKQSGTTHLGRELCAFANATGGVVLIGVADDGRLVGVRDANRLKSEVQNVARSIEPPLVIDVDVVDNIRMDAVEHIGSGIKRIRQICDDYGTAAHWPNLTVKKIPKRVLTRCERGHDDYSLRVENLAVAEPQPFALEGQKRAEATRPVKNIGDMDDLFGDLE